MEFSGLNWRDSARPLRFFVWDAKVVVFLLMCAFHVRIWTFALAVIAMAAFAYMERRQLNFDSALRWVRAQFAGRFRPPRPDTRLRWPVDYGQIPWK